MRRFDRVGPLKARKIYCKIGASSRTQAARWGVANGFTPDHHRINHRRGGP